MEQSSTSFGTLKLSYYEDTFISCLGWFVIRHGYRAQNSFAALQPIQLQAGMHARWLAVDSVGFETLRGISGTIYRAPGTRIPVACQLAAIALNTASLILIYINLLSRFSSEKI